jgi:hypothetical protein
MVEMKGGRTEPPQLLHGVRQLIGSGADEMGSTRDSDGTRSELTLDLGQGVEEARMATPAKDEGAVAGRENQRHVILVRIRLPCVFVAYEVVRTSSFGLGSIADLTGGPYPG